jgi:hypothetical protein
MRLHAFRIKGQRVIERRFGFGQVSFTDRQRRISNLKVRVIVLREFPQLLFCCLILLRGNRSLRQKGKSRSVIGRLVQNLGRFLKRLVRLTYSEIHLGKLVAIVQIRGGKLPRLQQVRARSQGHAFVRPHGPRTSVGNGIR